MKKRPTFIKQIVKRNNICTGTESPAFTLQIVKIVAYTPNKTTIQWEKKDFENKVLPSSSQTQYLGFLPMIHKVFLTELPKVIKEKINVKKVNF